MDGFLWGLLILVLAICGTVAGTAFGDWRARRAGRPVDDGDPDI